jgi:hypothetical protein
MSQPIDIADARETFEEGTVLQWTVWCGQHLDALLDELEAARAEIERLKKERADMDQSMDILLRHCGI